MACETVWEPVPKLWMIFGEILSRLETWVEGWVHTCNATTYRNVVTLQVTHTIRSYELNFHPVPHGVTVSYERYTFGFPVCYGSASDVFAASSGFVQLHTHTHTHTHIYIYIYICAAVPVCWQTEIFSLSVGYIRISPECLPVNLNF